MAVDSKTQAKLDAYVCPTCRLLFSSDLNQVGVCASCPGCENPVKIPLVGEEEDFIRLRSSRRYAQAGSQLARERQEAANRRREAWDRPVADEPGEEGKQPLPWIWIVPAALAGLAVVGVMISIVAGYEPVAPVERDVAAAKERTVEKEPEMDPEVAGEEYVPSEHDALLEKSLRGILAATSVEEMLPFVRKVEGIEEKMRGYYESQPFFKPNFSKLLRSAGLLDNRAVVSFAIQLDNYTNRDGLAVLKDGEVLVDWERFVLYSDLPWDTLAEEKPTSPVEVWAVALPSSYYNFGFEDSEWKAYELVSPYEERSFIGYAKLNSSSHSRLRQFGNGSNGVRCVLKVRFPEDSPVTNQVIIEEVVKSDWMIETGVDQP